MTVSGESRVEKLESVLLSKLTPKDRARMVLTAAASGNAEQARRVGQACPRKTYSMADADYLDCLEDGHRLCKAAIAHFRQYVFAWREIEAVKGILCGTVAGMIASHASTLTVAAMLKDRDGDTTDWTQVDAAGKEARQVASEVMGRMLDAMQGGLRCRVRAEWAGLETVCREETGLDAWTLFKGYKVADELIADIREMLAANKDGDSESASDEAALAEGLALWREGIQGRREGQRSVAAG